MAETALTREAGWRTAEPTWELGADDLHVWRWQLATDPAALQRLKALLSPDEAQRADRFHFRRHREQYILSRGTLRLIFANYLASEPSALQFDYGHYGKPQLRGGDLQFNLAHSGSYAVLAVSNTHPVGIDIEATHLPEDADLLVQRFFASREAELFQTVPPEAKAEAFMNLWTRKEAWLKATGEGISHLLARIEVSFLPGAEPRLLRMDTPHFHIEDWQFFPLPQWRGYTTALATRSDYFQPRCFSWTHPPS